MPKPKFGSNKPNAKANSKNPNDWSNFEFISLRLSDSQRDQFNVWYKSDISGFITELTAMITGNYKLTCTYDGTSACFISSLTCKEETDPNYGYVLTSRSPDLMEAIALNVFKTVEICTELDWPKDTQRNNWG